ncbi:MAG: hypothetical protein KGH61_02690 [Candidatus Micrarchaeota archaeon]|nr:hypothetical protein [Candidatus Micrarchaeota archaeon]MDE1847833.1 hypothetical protein [Candidatus Micrarchaeota archaeon]MDE1864361.1 hypothetical protein [Candidatus Micrarchaeota archaeon]
MQGSARQRIAPEFGEARAIGSGQKPELFVAKRVSDWWHDTTYQIIFNGTRVFDLKATGSGIKAIAIWASGDSVLGYNFKYAEPLKGERKDAPLLRISEVQKDERGGIYIAEYRGVEIYNFLVTNPGYARGGHSHPGSVNFHMVSGTGVWYMLGDDGEKIVVQSAGERVSVEGGVNHYVVSLTPTLKSEIASEGPKGEPFTATNDERSRATVTYVNNRQGIVKWKQSCHEQIGIEASGLPDALRDAAEALLARDRSVKKFDYEAMGKKVSEEIASIDHALYKKVEEIALGLVRNISGLRDCMQIADLTVQESLRKTMRSYMAHLNSIEDIYLGEIVDYRNNVWMAMDAEDFETLNKNFVGQSELIKASIRSMH